MIGEPKKRGRKSSGAKPAAKPVKPRKKRFSDDSDLLKRVGEGVQLMGQVADLGFTHLLGVAAGVWNFNEAEAEIMAKWLLSEADAGSSAAIQTIEKAVDYAHRINVAMVIVPKAVTTVREVIENGVRPPWLGDRSKRAGEDGEQA